MRRVYRLNLINDFECELNRALHAGKIHSFINIHKQSDFNQVHGVEIMLKTETTPQQLRKLKTYIEMFYKFRVDIDSLIENNSKVKIIIVEY